MPHHLLRGLIIAVLLTAFASSGKAQGRAREMSASDVAGTWSGQSICFGKRTGCKNEVVVYRFEPVAGKSTVITLLADKIVKGKRVPMYKLDFEYDELRRTIVADFAKGNTRGTWQYKIFDDTMDGTATVSPGNSVARRVKVKRVREDQVPAAPDRNSYEP
jgi:hypothetical protein